MNYINKKSVSKFCLGEIFVSKMHAYFEIKFQELKPCIPRFIFYLFYFKSIFNLISLKKIKKYIFEILIEKYIG